MGKFTLKRGGGLVRGWRLLMSTVTVLCTLFQLGWFVGLTGVISHVQLRGGPYCKTIVISIFPGMNSPPCSFKSTPGAQQRPLFWGRYFFEIWREPSPWRVSTLPLKTLAKPPGRKKQREPFATHWGKRSRSFLFAIVSGLLQTWFF